MNFKTIKDADEYFNDLGFNKYNNQFCHTGVVANYQKCFKDEIGKKYFIDVSLWDFTAYPQLNRYDYVAEYNGQYYQKGTHSAFNITTIKWEYEQMVEFIEKLFDKGVLDYYERWEE